MQDTATQAGHSLPVLTQAGKLIMNWIASAASWPLEGLKKCGRALGHKLSAERNKRVEDSEGSDGNWCIKLLSSFGHGVPMGSLYRPRADDNMI